MTAIILPARLTKIKGVLRTLVEKYPDCFAPSGAPKRPLKVGISADIAATIDPGDTSSDLARYYKSALAFYTRSKSYLVAMAAGAQRVDLNGQPAGAVTEEQAAWAAIKLGHLREKDYNDPVKAKRRKGRHGRMLSARVVLMNKWPKCFLPFGRDKKPLKRGILDDIKRRMHANEWATLPFEHAVQDYTSGETYTRNCIDGATCIDLDGNPAGYVGEVRTPKTKPAMSPVANTAPHADDGGHHVIRPSRYSQSERGREILSAMGQGSCPAPSSARGGEGAQASRARIPPVVVVKRARRLSTAKA